jgi:TonB family protein
MKSIRNLIQVLIVGLFVVSAASAANTVEQAYVESYRGRTDIPVPVKVVSPIVTSEYSGTSVTLVFTVDTKGVPHNISVPANVDSELANALTDAVQFWKFAPAVRNGQPVETKIELPINIVDDATTVGTKIAAK